MNLRSLRMVSSSKPRMSSLRFLKSLLIDSLSRMRMTQSSPWTVGRMETRKSMVRWVRRTIDFRVSILPTVHGEDCVIRILDKESMSKDFKNLKLDILGFDDDTMRKLRKFIREPYGMVLVTGPTGSGKTTTLYACLSEIQS